MKTAILSLCSIKRRGDRTILAKQLNISPQQMKYVTHTEAGEGLIFAGNVVLLPFVDHFPKDTELYRVMTTKPEEVRAAYENRCDYQQGRALCLKRTTL